MKYNFTCKNCGLLMNKCSVFPLEVLVLFYGWIHPVLCKWEMVSIK